MSSVFRATTLKYAERASDVLDLLASGLSFEQILDEMPDLEREDIVASIQFATRRVDHAVIAA